MPSRAPFAINRCVIVLEIVHRTREASVRVRPNRIEASGADSAFAGPFDILSSSAIRAKTFISRGCHPSSGAAAAASTSRFRSKVMLRAPFALASCALAVLAGGATGAAFDNTRVVLLRMGTSATPTQVVHCYEISSWRPNCHDPPVGAATMGKQQDFRR